MSESTIAKAATPDQNGQPVAAPAPDRAEVAGRTRAGRRVVTIGAVVAVGLAVALAAATLPRWRQQRSVNAAAAAAAAAPPRVAVTTARPMASDAERVLPGNSLPLLEASLFARATGYVKTRQ